MVASTMMSTSAAAEAGALFSRKTTAIFYNYKKNPIQRMLDFDFICARAEPSVAAIVSPGATPGGFQKAFFGKEEVAIPVYGSTEAAAAAHPSSDVFINFASYRSAYSSSYVALKQPSIRTIAIIAEGVPERDTKKLITYANRNSKVIIGPATVGGVQAGAFKIGDTAGTVENIITCKLHRPGSVGFVSKSGGLSNEMYNVLARVTDGLYEGIAVGGDAYAGSGLADHVLRYQSMDEVKLVVLLGELGGSDEYGVVEGLKDGRIKKPVVAWVSGTCANWFNAAEVQFGHAGAKSGGEDEGAEAKNNALRDAGAHVPENFDGFADLIASVYQDMVKDGSLKPAEDVEPPNLPQDLASAIKAGEVRKTTNIVCTISNDMGEEPTYVGIPISEIMKDYTMGDVISLLWFKTLFPKWATKFIELVLVTAADHGPCVSGAHNTIVAARAGKDLISSLCSGLLTIGPRFGGAVDAAAINFKRACDSQIPPDEFVESLKKKGQRVEGIGHRIKTAENRDKRVELLANYAKQHFPEMGTFLYAKKVEEYTLQKANNLVLNIDGAIGSLFADMLKGVGKYSDSEVMEVLELGGLNGLFTLSRSIGFIGHALDQKRMKQPLYRHPWDDVLYAEPERPSRLANGEDEE
ncbi:ATP citrate lyase [Chondrus crispus]|uniref:ATP citrate synthase n=1 Tax=Chondrus crispus TaxID=2769 RepID=R7Q472_CHOCR|nr:ATP citrate lyase [Chondrus crispus]CDF32141.1 ATP citrate lyase [Chondrus crispus]|eukprot:XP_005711806.1 ATP citrate lyase [Chondrus crispus]